MTIEIDFTYAIDGFYHSVNYYRSDAPMNIDSMPQPTVTDINGLTFVDTTAENNKRYYVRFGAVRGGIEKISNEIVVNTIDNPIQNLFNNNEKGFWYDFQDIRTLFQDEEGTIPVTASGQKVGRIIDKSGNGWHLQQSDISKRPIVSIDSLGRVSLIFDGVKTFLTVANTNFGSATNFSLFIAQKKLTDAASGMLVERSNTLEYTVGAFNFLAPASSGLRKYSTALGMEASSGLSGVYAFTESSLFNAPKFNALYSKIFINNSGKCGVDLNIDGAHILGSQASRTYAGFGIHNMYIGSRAGNSVFFNGHIYEIAGVARECTSAEELDINNHMMSYGI